LRKKTGKFLGIHNYPKQVGKHMTQLRRTSWWHKASCLYRSSRSNWESPCRGNGCPRGSL